MSKREKAHKTYVDDWIDDGDEFEPPWSFDLQDKLSTDRFNVDFTLELQGKDFTLEWVQKNGLSRPLVFHSPQNLGIKMPDKNFTINDVRNCVGSRRVLDVMDVNSQKNLQMTMREWQTYYDSSEKTRLLNVISLEFSHTKLERHVRAPTVVRQLDWVECVWPRVLRELQTEATNALNDMMYPKVQKYCLMSVSGCYTDFHVDFGGTSVWYHVLRGMKYFWLIPPTDANMVLFEKWMLSGKQSDVFFGDTVPQCSRICLRAGDTFFIPTGWIHAVYTPVDSLVFGGNFLHSFGVEKQLRVYKMEDVTKVEQRYRYPFFVEMLWYVLERYVCCLTQQSFIALRADADSDSSECPLPPQLAALISAVPPPPPAGSHQHVHLTPYELNGIKAIVLYLHALPASRRCVPELISEPAALIDAVRRLVLQHQRDSPLEAITGRPTLYWPDDGQELRMLLQGFVRSTGDAVPATDVSARRSTTSVVTTPAKQRPPQPSITSTSAGSSKKQQRRARAAAGDADAGDAPDTKVAHSMGLDENAVGGGAADTSVGTLGCHRVHCGQCVGCLSDNCRQCAACCDKVQNDGSGSIKQLCQASICHNPQLSASCVCVHCGERECRQCGDTLQRLPSASRQLLRHAPPDAIYECRRCHALSHVLCSLSRAPVEAGAGRLLEGGGHWWLCPECERGADVGCDGGYAGNASLSSRDHPHQAAPPVLTQTPRVGKVRPRLTAEAQPMNDGESSAGAVETAEQEARSFDAFGTVDVKCDPDSLTAVECGVVLEDHEKMACKSAPDEPDAVSPSAVKLTSHTDTHIELGCQ